MYNPAVPLNVKTAVSFFSSVTDQTVQLWSPATKACELPWLCSVNTVSAELAFRQFGFSYCFFVCFLCRLTGGGLLSSQKIHLKGFRSSRKSSKAKQATCQLKISYTHEFCLSEGNVEYVWPATFTTCPLPHFSTTLCSLQRGNQDFKIAPVATANMGDEDLIFDSHTSTDF